MKQVISMICICMAIFVITGCVSQSLLLNRIQKLPQVECIAGYNLVDDDNFSSIAMDMRIVLKNGGRLLVTNVDYDRDGNIKFGSIARFGNMMIEEFIYTKNLDKTDRGRVSDFDQYDLNIIKEFSELVHNRNLTDLIRNYEQVENVFMALPYVKTRWPQSRLTPKEYIETLPNNVVFTYNSELYIVYRTDLIPGVYDDF